MALLVSPAYLPALIVSVAAITLLAILNRLIHGPRVRAHECPACRYDRRGLPEEAICPECGHPAPARA